MRYFSTSNHSCYFSKSSLYESLLLVECCFFFRHRRQKNTVYLTYMSVNQWENADSKGNIVKGARSWGRAKEIPQPGFLSSGNTSSLGLNLLTGGSGQKVGSNKSHLYGFADLSILKFVRRTMGKVLVISFWSFHAMLCLISAWPVTPLSTAPRPKLRHTWPTSPLLTDVTKIKGKTRSRRHTALSHDFLFQSSSSLFGESYSLTTHQKLIAGALI